MNETLAASLAAAWETPRLSFEPVVEAHADAFFAALQDEELYRWISMPKPTSLAELRARWRRNECRLSPDRVFAWPSWAVRRKADGCYLGRMDAEINATLEAVNLGYYFFTPHRGSGYATEATRAIIQALTARGVRRFVATVTVGNRASARVLQKAGFAFTRILPGNDVIRGIPFDDEEYVLDRTLSPSS